MIVTLHQEACFPSAAWVVPAPHGWGISPGPLLHPLPQGRLPHVELCPNFMEGPGAWPLSGGHGRSSQSCPVALWARVLCNFVLDTQVRQIDVSIVSVFTLSKEGGNHRLCVLLADNGQEAGSVFLPTPLLLFPQHLSMFWHQRIKTHHQLITSDHFIFKSPQTRKAAQVFFNLA